MVNVFWWIGLLVAALLFAAAYLYKVLIQPRHLVIGWTPGGGYTPQRLKKIPAIVRFKRQDGTVAAIPMVGSFGEPRTDGKGFVYLANIATGQLMRLKPEGTGGAINTHGMYLEHALADTREQKWAAAAGHTGITLKHILIGVAVLGGMLLIIMFLIVKAFAGGGGDAPEGQAAAMALGLWR